VDATVTIAIALAAFVGLALMGWGMWLEHRQERRVLDIVAAAIEAGREPPAELLARLAGPGGAEATGPRRRALQRLTILFLVVAAACFVASWAATEAAREQALLLAAAILGLAGVGLALVLAFGRRLGL
jgi:hypothetical protein